MRERVVLALLLAAALNAGCGREGEQPSRQDAAPSATTSTPPPPTTTPAPATESLPPVTPPAPGTPGGLPDDRTPISEAPFSPTSAQGAANVVQTYYALIGEHRYRDAWSLWTQSGEGSGMTADAFAKSFDVYESYNANIGAPGEIEGAAGSLYVTVPVQIYGRRKSGEEIHGLGKATLRRVNDVPGSTPEQRAWHIFKIDVPL